MKKVWLLENEQARWFEFEEPHDMPDDVTVTMLTETEQPAQQEPVAWMDEKKRIVYWHNTHDVDDYHGFKRTTPLYTSPPKRKPLTDEEIDALWHDTAPYYDHQDFAHAIEAAHGITGEKK